MNVQKKLKKDNKKIQFLNIVQLKSVTVKEETKTEKIKPIKKKKKINPIQFVFVLRLIF